MPFSRYEHPELSDVPLSRALAALADPCRVAIVRAIVESGCEMACNEFDLAQKKATVSHHFRTLREGGVIRTRTEGTKCLNSLRREEFDLRFPGLLDLVLAEGDPAAPLDPEAGKPASPKPVGAR